MKESYSMKALSSNNYIQNMLPSKNDLNNITISNYQDKNKIQNIKQKFHFPKQNSISIASIKENALISNYNSGIPALNPEVITTTSHKFQLPIRINKKKMQRNQLINSSYNSPSKKNPNDNFSNFLNYRLNSSINKLNFNKLKKLDEEINNFSLLEVKPKEGFTSKQNEKTANNKNNKILRNFYYPQTARNKPSSFNVDNNMNIINYSINNNYNNLNYNNINHINKIVNVNNSAEINYNDMLFNINNDLDDKLNIPLNSNVNGTMSDLTNKYLNNNLHNVFNINDFKSNLNNINNNSKSNYLMYKNLNKDINNIYYLKYNNEINNYKINNSAINNNRYNIKNSLYNNNEFNFNNKEYSNHNQNFTNNNKYIINDNNYYKNALDLNNNYINNNNINNNESYNYINGYYNNRSKISNLYKSQHYKLINKTLDIEPDFNFNLSEFITINQIGKGSEGIIYSVKWIKNNKKYALKKGKLKNLELVQKRQEEIMMLKKFSKNTGSDGVIKIYGNLYIKNMKGYYDYYEIMELAEIDWDLEIKNREKMNLFYEENELMKIMYQIVKTFSLLQKSHITHRDIKPQNIMIVNGKFKVCDFGNARILKRDGLVVQRIRGSEMFMSPIIFKAYHSKNTQVKHHTFKSDVFSLGMCFLLAANLSYDLLNSIREVYDMITIENIIYNYLGGRYSQKVINILISMLQIDEYYRPDFIHLETFFSNYPNYV